MNQSTEEMEIVNGILDKTQKVVLALKLYASGLSEETKALREQAVVDRGMILDMSRRMVEMEIRMNLLQERTSGRAALVDLTIPEVPVLGSPIRMSSPPGIRWSQRASVTPQLGESSLRMVEDLAQEWVRSEDGSPELS